MRALFFACAATAMMVDGCGPSASHASKPRSLPIPAESHRMVKTTDAFTADLPPGFVIHVSQGIDFDIVDIRKGNTAYVGLYVGNYPSFPVEGGAGGTVEEHATNPVKTTTIVVNGRPRVNEYLWKTGYDEPAYIHVWPENVSSDQQPIADQIAASVRPK